MPLTANSLLVFLLRLMGVSALLALVAVFMPMSWMAATHRWLGLGEMPTVPIVEYLARSLSAFYFFFGTLCLLAASSLDRYRQLVRLLALAFVVMGSDSSTFWISILASRCIAVILSSSCSPTAVASSSSRRRYVLA